MVVHDRMTTIGEKQMKKRQRSKRLLFLIFTLLMSLCFSGCFLFDEGETLEKGVLRVGMNLNIDKLCYLSSETNKPEGFEVELAGLLADRMDLELEIVDTTEKNLLKSLDGRIYDCVISGVGLSQWNRIHYGYTDAYLDLSQAEDQTEEEDTRIAIFTRKGNSLEKTLEKNLEELKEEGTLKKLSVKYFGKDITI